MLNEVVGHVKHKVHIKV